MTVAVFDGRIAGMPLRIHLPEGVPYSFFRKYLLRPPRAPLADAALAERVRRAACWRDVCVRREPGDRGDQPGRTAPHAVE
jgi:hypothetical protein